VSYEVPPPFKICGIAWEMRCLNESSLAQPDLWAKQVLTYSGGGPVLATPSRITHWGTSILPPKWCINLSTYAIPVTNANTRLALMLILLLVLLLLIVLVRVPVLMLVLVGFMLVLVLVPVLVNTNTNGTFTSNDASTSTSTNYIGPTRPRRRAAAQHYVFYCMSLWIRIWNRIRAKGTLIRNLNPSYAL
jgi:hypothetical protein